jgi:hypothetical protein
MSIISLVNETSKLKAVGCTRRNTVLFLLLVSMTTIYAFWLQHLLFHSCPTRFFDFRWGIAVSIGNNSSKCLSQRGSETVISINTSLVQLAYQYHRTFFLHRIQQLESTQLPFSSFICEDGRNSYVSMDHPTIIIDELDGILYKLFLVR